MTHKAHDALFKATFETPEHAAAVFRQILPATIVAAIDWDTIVPQSGSFIDPDLRDRHTDLLFAVRLRDDTGGPPVLLYLLLEHQSTNDDDMPFRMLVYLVRILERYQKTHGGPLPIVIPAVVAHPLEGWTAPTRLHDLFDPPPELDPRPRRARPRLLAAARGHLERERRGSAALGITAVREADPRAPPRRAPRRPPAPQPPAVGLLVHRAHPRPQRRSEVPASHALRILGRR